MDQHFRREISHNRTGVQNSRRTKIRVQDERQEVAHVLDLGFAASGNRKNHDLASGSNLLVRLHGNRINRGRFRLDLIAFDVLHNILVDEGDTSVGKPEPLEQVILIFIQITCLSFQLHFHLIREKGMLVTFGQFDQIITDSVFRVQLESFIRIRLRQFLHGISSIRTEHCTHAGEKRQSQKKCR